MEEAHEKLLKMLDEAYQKLKSIHTDKDFLNDNASEYKDALENFLEAQKDIFRFKNLWSVIDEYEPNIQN